MKGKISKKLIWVKPVLECIGIPRLTRGDCANGSIPGVPPGADPCSNGATALGCTVGNDDFL